MYDRSACVVHNTNCSLNSLQGFYMGLFEGLLEGVIKGDTRR